MVKGLSSLFWYTGIDMDAYTHTSSHTIFFSLNLKFNLIVIKIERKFKKSCRLKEDRLEENWWWLEGME